MNLRINKSIEKMQFIIDDLGMANPNMFSESLGFDSPEIIYKILRGKTAISKNLAMLVNEKHPQYSIDWLLTGNVESDKDTIMINLDDTIFHKQNNLNKLIPFLSQNHNELRKRVPIYDMYVVSIEQEYKAQMEIERLRNKATGKD